MPCWTSPQESVGDLHQGSTTAAPGFIYALLLDFPHINALPPHLRASTLCCWPSQHIKALPGHLHASTAGCLTSPCINALPGHLRASTPFCWTSPCINALSRHLRASTPSCWTSPRIYALLLDFATHLRPASTSPGIYALLLDFPVRQRPAAGLPRSSTPLPWTTSRAECYGLVDSHKSILTKKRTDSCSLSLNLPGRVKRLNHTLSIWLQTQFSQPYRQIKEREPNTHD